MKNNIGDLVAQSMLNVLNSKEHAAIFKKAYKVAGANCNYCGDMGDCSMCGDMSSSDDASSDDNMSHDHKITRLPYRGHEFGGSHISRLRDDDSGPVPSLLGNEDYKKYLRERKIQKHLPTIDSPPMGEWDVEDMEEGEDLEHDFERRRPLDFGMSDDNWIDSEEESSLSDKTAAYYDAMQDLITASAALDYADFNKAAELSIKIASLVSKTKEKMDEKDSGKSSSKSKKSSKGKKPVKGKIPPQFKKKMNSSSSKSSSSSKPSSSKKMTMDEKMKMLREKMNK